MGLFRRSREPERIVPDGYTAGFGAPAPAVDVVVYLPREAKVVGLDGATRAEQRGPGLALVGDRDVLVMRQGVLSGMAGSAQLDLTRQRPGGDLVARVARVGPGQFSVDGPVGPLGFDRRAGAEVSARYGCNGTDFGGIWDLVGGGASLARSIPRYEQGRGLVSLVIERYESTLPLTTVVFLLAAREAVATPANPNR